jgi:predicted metal-dependent HD superfamily phosphohydrolase
MESYHMTDLERWQTLWKKLNGKTRAEEVFHLLAAFYFEPHRAYHTLAHIRHCLDEFDRVRHLATSADALETAIWFHDAIYQPGAKNNEENSARLAEQVLFEAEAPTDFIAEVAKLILATKHAVMPDTQDAKLLVDIDLSILGASEEVFNNYEKGIRFEYMRVPWFLYKRKRARLLQSFLKRSHIYLTEAFRRRYEKQARQNLARSVAVLQGK